MTTEADPIFALIERHRTAKTPKRKALKPLFAGCLYSQNLPARVKSIRPRGVLQARTPEASLRLRFIKTFASIFFILCAVAWILFQSENGISIAEFGALSLKTIALCAVALFVSNVLAIARLKLVSASFGYRVPWVESAAALSVGAIGGAIFFQLPGQLIGRNTILARLQMPPSAVVLITGLERVISMLVSVAIALAGTLAIYGRALSIDYASGGGALIRIVAGLAFVLGFVAAVCWRKPLTDLAQRFTVKGVVGVTIALVLSVAIQVATMAAYISLAAPFVSAERLPELFAAVAIVMFLASVPISFAGWGIRELSAVAAFGSIGIMAQSAFIVAATVGALSIVTMLVIAAVSSPLLGTKIDKPSIAGAMPQPIAIEAAVGPLAAVLLLFSIYVPVNSGFANVTLSDPVAILGGGLFVLHHISRRSLPSWPAWNLNGIIAAATAVVLASYLIGVARYGPTAWAATKATGWFVLLAYFATGAIAVRSVKDSGAENTLWAFACASAAVLAFDQIAAVAGLVVNLPAIAKSAYQYAGFSNNRNAFAFIALLAIAASLATERRGAATVAAMAFAGLFLSGSRTGFICLPAVIACIAICRRATWQKVVGALWGGAVAYAFFGFAIPYTAGDPLAAVAVQPSNSEAEHIATAIGGTKLFLSYPIFGAGLGAYLVLQQGDTAPAVIHSTPLWLLSEMGLIGFSVFTAAFVSLAAQFLKHRHSFAGCMGLSALVALAIFGLAHEILYQRAIWLFLGASIAACGVIGSKPALRRAAALGEGRCRDIC